MATKKKLKKVASAVPAQLSVSKSVEVKKISNGYIVSTWVNGGNKEKFAKTKKEAKIIAGKML